MAKEHLRKEDLLSLVLWLEHTPNFEKCFGVTKKTAVGQKQVSKTDGFREMAAALKKTSKSRFDLKGRQMKERFKTYKTRYMKARDYGASTGAGITADDEANDLHTMAQKLEAICPWFEKMDALFGAKANVSPLSMFDSTSVAINAPDSDGGDEVPDFDLSGFSSPGTNDGQLTASPLLTQVTLPADTSPIVASDGSRRKQPSLPSSFVSIPGNTAAGSTASVPPSRKRKPQPVRSSAAGEKRHAPLASRQLKLPSLSSSPPSTSAGGPRNAIAGAMKVAAKTKANIDKERLQFERERWTSEADRQQGQQAIEHDRLTFEKQKWETERVDRRVEMEKQQRFQVLSSLIEKGRTAEEAKAFLDLL